MTTHASLFSGIGGFDLAAQWIGWENVFHCENNEFCQKILKYHFPESVSYADIKSTDFNIHRGQIDVLSGGFPCQPFSLAGKRRGTEDARFLFPEMLRAIREIQPKYIVAENVFGLIASNGGVVFEQVCTSLESEGYEVLPFILPACGVNAPHRRDRVWIVAHSEVWRLEGQRESLCACKQKENIKTVCANEGDCGRRNKNLAERKNQWQIFPTQSPLCSRDDGLSDRLDGISVSQHRTESLKAYGNAIVPQVAYEIFKAILLGEEG